MTSGVILLQRSYISFSSPLLLILRQEITAAAVALLVLEFWDGKPTYGKPTYRKSLAGNLLVWSDLTFDPSFKVK